MPNFNNLPETQEAVSFGQLWRQVARALPPVGGETAVREARLLISHALALSPSHLVAYPEDTCRAVEQARVWDFVRRRTAGEPLSRIVGHREFWSLEFSLNQDTLDPRPDSECLVESALAQLERLGISRASPLRVLDMGTGSGCLLLALLSELPNGFGVGTDLSAQAVEQAQENARGLQMSARAAFVCGSWGAALSPSWDIVMSNPPYIPSGDIPALAPEVQYDPRRALDGGADGLAAYRALLPQAAALMKDEALLLLEVGEGQAAKVTELAVAAGLTLRTSAQDLSGVERCVVLGKAKLNDGAKKQLE